jgi:aryl-alcohol dehydrogenase-like predicted oxidoreductase
VPSGTLGSSGLRVTRIGLGLAALGRPAYITLGREDDLGGDRSRDAMERRCHEMLDEAYGAGIRYLDAARSYGRAEEFLASWLRARDLPPDAVTVGSKWGYSYVGGWRMDSPQHETKDLSRDTLRRQIAETRGYLHQHLDLYQVHSATLESGVLDDRAVLSALSRLRAEGVRIGLTVTGPRQADVIRRALTIVVDGVTLFQTVQATWNLLETSAGEALSLAHTQGVGVIVKESLANGRLTDAHAGSEIEPIRRAAQALNAPVDAYAFAAALANPWADVVLSGAVSRDQLRSNLRGLTLTLAPGSLSIAQPPDLYWDRRKTLSWS